MAKQTTELTFPPEGKPRFSNTQIVSAFVVLFAGAFFLSLVTTGITDLEAGKLGVVVNNISGKVTTVTEPGLIFHLPLGLTDVYVLEATLQSFDLAGSSRSQESGGIKIKSRDGSDIFIDASVTFSIDKKRGELIAREIGTEEAFMRDLLVAYTRSVLRDELGKLHIEEVIEAESRNRAVAAFKGSVEERARQFGIDINTIAAQNPSFNPEYERLIGERKRADQDFTNQGSAQGRARSNQQLLIAEASRQSEVAVREEEGKQQRRLIEARAKAEEIVRRAEGEAYRVRTDGERQRDVAVREAEAVRAEGLKKAEGIRALAEAYREGGLGLVREALAAKYVDARINGRPYSLDSQVQRLSLEGAAATTAAAPRRAAD